MRKLVKVVVGLFLILIAIGVVGNLLGDNGSNRSASPTASASPEQQAQWAQLIKQPDAEAQFVQAVSNAQIAFRGAKDQFAEGSTRPARRQAVCSLSLGRSLIVKDWVGQVSNRTTNGDGKGVLGIKLVKDVVLTTWNNGLSDIGDGTLIEPGSPVFKEMGSLTDGDWVRLSGRFFRSDTDCVKEQSMTIRGSMTSPEYTFKFENISRIDLPK